MRRFLIAATIITASLLLLTACHKAEDGPTMVVAGGYSSDLANLFPNLEGAKWKYYGTADYAQHMQIDKIYETGSQKVISISGEVEDLSDGESKLDHRLELTYKIGSDRITQSKISDVMMDSEYDKMTLIMAPLEKGTTWTENVVDSQGKKVKLKGEIIGVEDDPEGKIYKVRYEETDSDYSEVRKIQVGKGVIDFVKTLKYQDQSLELSYHIYELKLPDLAAAQTTSQNSGDLDQIKGTIFKYDELWVAYVNQGSTEINAYVAAGSPVANMIAHYGKDGSQIKYLSIEVKNIEIHGEEATAVVYEKMQQTKSDQTEVYEYNWQYKLVKQGAQWLISSYEEAK